jgi:hypothetical protein
MNRELRDLLGVEAGEGRALGDVVGAGVRVADVGGEEVEEAEARVFAGVGDQFRHNDSRDGDRLGATIATARVGGADRSSDPIAALPTARLTGT